MAWAAMTRSYLGILYGGRRDAKTTLVLLATLETYDS
jgi:hypothetical protein